MNEPTLSREDAQALCEALHLSVLFESEVEIDLLEETNPRLLQAYEALRAIADGDEA